MQFTILIDAIGHLIDANGRMCICKTCQEDDTEEIINYRGLKGSNRLMTLLFLLDSKKNLFWIEKGIFASDNQKSIAIQFKH